MKTDKICNMFIWNVLLTNITQLNNRNALCNNVLSETRDLPLLKVRQLQLWERDGRLHRIERHLAPSVNRLTSKVTIGVESM